MTPDRYTKTALTVIAICLCLITLKQFSIFPAAIAGNTTAPTLFPSANYGLVPLDENGKVSVSLNPTEELRVNIVSIDTYDKLKVNLAEIDAREAVNTVITEVNLRENLDVNIKEVGGCRVPYGGPLDVKVK